MFVGVHDRLSGRRATWFDGSRHGEVEIDAAYIYASVNVASSSGAPQGVA